MEELISLSEEFSVSELFDEIIKKISYFSYLTSSYDDGESRIESIKELKSSIAELENVVDNLTLREYLENISLISATDDLENEREYVKLMTIHNSKGLEFPIVFLVGMEDELFPNTNDGEELEEERRLCYVAITRAEEKLYMSWVRERFVYGEMQNRTKSRFIDEIPEELFEIVKNPLQQEYFSKIKSNENLNKNSYSSNSEVKKIEKQIEEIKSLPYKVGDTVTHIKFGLGKVVGITEKKFKYSL